MGGRPGGGGGCADAPPNGKETAARATANTLLRSSIATSFGTTTTPKPLRACSARRWQKRVAPSRTLSARARRYRGRSTLEKGERTASLLEQGSRRYGYAPETDFNWLATLAAIIRRGRSRNVVSGVRPTSPFLLWTSGSTDSGWPASTLRGPPETSREAAGPAGP
jgi:hypothetical protein